jgi:hypothetical protein
MNSAIKKSRCQFDIIASWDKIPWTVHFLLLLGATKPVGFCQEFRYGGGSGHAWQVGKRVPIKANKSLGMPRAF